MPVAPAVDLRTDVLVVGGGLSGTWSALGAAEAGANVVLVDKWFCGTSGVTATAGVGHWWVPPDERDAVVAARKAISGGLADEAWMPPGSAANRSAAELGARLSGMEFSSYYTMAPADSTMTRSMSYLFGDYVDADGRAIDVSANPRWVTDIARRLLDGPVRARLARMPAAIRALMPEVQPNFLLPFDRRGIDPYEEWFEGAGIRRSLAVLDGLWADAVPSLGGGDPRAALRSREAAAMTAVARWCYRAALARAETQGMHLRDDRPTTREAFSHRLVTSGLERVEVRPYALRAQPDATARRIPA